MRLEKHRCLTVSSGIYLIYLICYTRLKVLLPEHIEVRAWVSVTALFLAIAAGAVLLLMWIRLFTRSYMKGQRRSWFVKSLSVFASVVVVAGAFLSCRMLIQQIPDETVSVNGTLLISVRESEDSMRLYYCEPVNAFLRKPFSVEDFRKTQR